MKKILFLLFLSYFLISNSIAQETKKTLIEQLKIADNIKSRDVSKAVSITNHVMAESDKHGYDSLWIRGAINLGNIYTENGSYEQSVNILNQAIERANKKGLELLSTHALSFLAQYYMKIGNYKTALKYYNQTYNIFEKHQDKTGLMRTGTGIGISFMYMASYDSAAKRFHQALEISKEINDVRAEGLINNNLGRLNKRKKDYDRAIIYLETSIVLLTKTGTLKSVMRSKLLLAEVYHAQGHYQKAMELSKISLTGAIKYEDAQNIVRSYNTIAEIYVSTNQVDSAVNYYKLGIEEGKRLNIKRIQLTSMIGYINLLIKQKNFTLAEKFIDDGIILSNEINTPENLLSIYKSLELMHVRTGNISAAYNISKKHQSLRDSLQERENRELTERLEIESETRKIENALIKSELKNSKNNQTILGLAIGIIIVMLIALAIYFANRVRQKNAFLQYERNEAILKRKNLEIQKNKEIESAKAEIKGQEEERNRLAKELHDGLGGTLATIKVNLSLVESEADNAIALKPIISSLDEACQEVRTISHHLMPKIFENKSLTHAIKKYMHDIQRGTKLEVNLEVYPEEEIEKINPAIKNDIYRIIQELTNNVLKHAEASYLDTQLIKHDEYISLIVEDNGIGFKKNNKNAGIGLGNINSRIALLKGTMNIDSQEKRGTLIDIQIPNEITNHNE